jgi:hypothetical protein
MGADVRTLLGTLRGAGPVPLKRWPLVATMLLSAAARSPLALLEKLALVRRRRRARPMEPPVFVIGHWRSGTTHLHNVLGKDPQFGHIPPLASGLPWNVLTLVTWLRPLLEKALPEDREVDRVAVTPDSPQEDEIPLASMQPLSVFHAVYFPHRFEERFDRGVFFDACSPGEIARWELRHRAFLEKIALYQQRPRLLVKNPVYTGRLSRLRALWPGAKFIHIVRNPYVVFQSTVHYYRKLIPGLALQPHAHLQLEPFVLRSYARLMARLDAQAADLSSPDLAEVRFEDLEVDPLGELERVYRELSLPGFKAAAPRFRAYLESLRGYRKNRFEALPPETTARIEARWKPYIERWGYRPPWHEGRPPEQA